MVFAVPATSDRHAPTSPVMDAGSICWFVARSGALNCAGFEVLGAEDAGQRGIRHQGSTAHSPSQSCGFLDDVDAQVKLDKL